MFVELLMKKNGKIIFALFLMLVVAATIFGGVLVYNTMNTDVYQFTKDGYVLVFNAKNKTKATAYSFKNGSEYQYKKNSNTINFEYEEEKVRLDENTIMHYSDGSLGVLKKVVGLDVSTVDRNIIFYYNIYKTTKINSTAEGFSIKLANESEVKFQNLLIRVSDNKFILTGKSVRLVIGEEIVDFGEYVEFEYLDGNVVKLYNQDRFYQTISADSHLLVNDVKINLSAATISKGNKEYISLTNLVVNNDGNIDALEEKIEKQEVYLEDGDVDVPTIEPPDTSVVEGDKEKPDNSGVLDDEEQKEEVVDKNKIENTPSYKVTELSVSALKVEAKIEIIDVDNLINSDTQVQIVENKTAKVVYEDTGTRGDAQVTLSCADLIPDTEYTLYARASYVIDGVEIDRVFLSKIFRTEDLGVSFESSLLSSSGITIELTKENYSKVNSVVIELYKSNGDKIDDRTIRFENGNVEYIDFAGLSSNSDYIVKMTQISSQNVIVDDGYSVSKTIKTLKEKPVIGDLAFEIDKKSSAFNLTVSSITDKDYGIQNYRYEVYFVDEGARQSTPSAVVNKKTLETAAVKVDGVNLVRDRNYTYVLVLEFYDNEKIVEYSRQLEYTMSLTGLRYPTIRVDNGSANLTWERYDSTIIIEDPDSVIQSNEFILTYKNSIDVSESRVVTSGKNHKDEYVIPIGVNGLRANDTYTFQVTGSIDLGDGNGVSSAYIGAVYVQTGNPNPIQADFVKNNDPTSVFSLRFSLGNPEGIDSTYEATTLTKIVLKLYRGENTEGEPFRTLTLSDTNEADYISTLDRDLYQGSGITITPKTFKGENTDFTDPKYTIVVDTAQDYTKHPNYIPIENKKFSFDLSGTLPLVPEGEARNDAVYITAIDNRNANDKGIPQQLDLAENTVFAYEVSPKFNNESKTARYINWEVYRKEIGSDEFVEVPSLRKVTEVNPNSTEVPSTIFEVSAGTTQDTVDTDKLRRGNTYYFKYTIELEIDGEKVYYPSDSRFHEPDDDVVLRSKITEVYKQSPIVDLYPSYSNILEDGSYKYVWKYRIYDVDHAIVENGFEEKELFFYQDGNADPQSKGVIETITSLNGMNFETAPFNTVEFYGLLGGKTSTMQYVERLNKNFGTNEVNLLTEYFSSIQSLDNLSYSVTQDVNRMVIQFDENEENQKILNSVASANVIVKPVESGVSPSEIRFDGQMLTSNTISIDFLQLADYIGKYIQVELELYYDTGRTGFDVVGEFGGYAAIQKVQSNENDKLYYKYDGTKLVGSSSLNGSMFKGDLRFNDNGNHVFYATPYGGSSRSFSIKVEPSGISYNKNYITMKQLGTHKVTGGNAIKFNSIIPGISVVDNNGQSTITGLLTEATIKANIQVNTEKSPINEAAGIEIEIRNIDDGTPAETKKFNRSDFDTQVRITGLKENTKYGVKFFAYVTDPEAEGGFTRVQLYDVDRMTNDTEYIFITIQKVEINNIKAFFNERSYTDKVLNISFSPSIVYGYKGIEYQLKNAVGNTIYTDTTTTLTTTMSVSIKAPPSITQQIRYGGEYTIVLRPYTQTVENGPKSYLTPASATFKLPSAQQPTVGISATKNDTSITFNVSIVDDDYTIINSKYKVLLKNSNGDVVVTLNDQDSKIVNNPFTFTKESHNLQEGEEYALHVLFDLDLTNTGEAAEEIDPPLPKTIVFGSGMNLGTITASKNKSNARAIDIVFKDSYKLTETVSTIQYTITNNDIEFTYSSSASFDKIQHNDKTDLYYYSIEIPPEVEKYEISHVYSIIINFYSRTGNLVGQTEVAYYYN